eukprot:1145068-Pelagomonas_calceolata.AAC.7
MLGGNRMRATSLSINSCTRACVCHRCTHIQTPVSLPSQPHAPSHTHLHTRWAARQKWAAHAGGAAPPSVCPHPCTRRPPQDGTRPPHPLPPPEKVAALGTGKEGGYQGCRVLEGWPAARAVQQHAS